VSPRSLLAAEVARPETELNLARAALLVAQEEYPQLSIELYLSRLEQLAEEVKDRLADETAPLVVLDELHDTLYVRQGFRGNDNAYYDPRNSFLNDVLDRRLGIPLTLGILFLEVGWRLGLPLQGVNFPGHFLVRYRGDALDLLLDPFDGGRARFEDESQELLDRLYGGAVKLRKSFLRRATRRDMLIRLLSNLKGVYVNTGDHARALGVVERLLILTPLSPAENRSRGVLLARMGRHEDAADQLEEYLRVAPDASDAERVLLMVQDLRAGREIPGREESR
jgi:regulator of sirC expression with transglutaminase-like and TPR domain